MHTSLKQTPSSLLVEGAHSEVCSLFEVFRGAHINLASHSGRRRRKQSFVPPPMAVDSSCTLGLLILGVGAALGVAVTMHFPPTLEIGFVLVKHPQYSTK